jgi:hypothetical protein
MPLACVWYEGMQVRGGGGRENTHGDKQKSNRAKLLQIADVKISKRKRERDGNRGQRRRREEREEEDEEFVEKEKKQFTVPRGRGEGRAHC